VSGGGGGGAGQSSSYFPNLEKINKIKGRYSKDDSPVLDL
jgi:hypothetical protein